MRRASGELPVDDEADALCGLLQQLRAGAVEPAPGFYGRVLDEIASRQAVRAAWYARFPIRLAVLCGALTSSAVWHLAKNPSVLSRDYYSTMSELTSSRPEQQRDAVLTLLLADPVLASPSR